MTRTIDESSATGSSDSLLSAAWLSVVLLVVLQVVMVAAGVVPVLHDELIGADSYVRFNRVMQLHETGHWYETVNPRGNAPYGEPSLWTRPLDVLLLAIAWPLRAVMAFDTALYWAAVVISPILQLFALVALIWAARPIVARPGLIWLGLLFVVQIAPTGYFVAGRADHHSLILLVFILSLGFNLRLILHPFRAATCHFAGLLGAFSIWLTLESMVALFVNLLTLVLIWTLRRPQFSRSLAHFSVALFLGLTIATTAEHPWRDWALVEYDRVSVVHWSLAAVNAAFWALVAGLQARRAVFANPWPRAVAIIAVAVFAGGAVWLVFPGFYDGPMGQEDPAVAEIWLDKVAEIRPLISWQRLEFGPALSFLGIALLALPHLAIHLAGARAATAWPGQAYIALGLIIFLPLALFYMVRWTPYAIILLLFPYADLLARVSDWLGRNLAPLTRSLVRPFVIVGLALGFSGLGLALEAVEPADGLFDIADDGTDCPLKPVARFLDDPDGLGARQRTILAFLDFGPEILYRTRHKVVGSPNLRNVDGILDSYAIFSATEDETARAGIAARRIDLILLCPGSGEGDMYRANRDDPDLYQRLATGDVPAWLRVLPLPEDLAAAFKLFEPVP